MARLNFYKTTAIGYISEALAETIGSKLESGQRVLWLLSGGSAIKVAVATANKLSASQGAAITVGLIDERYGEPGHSDSNWHQLQAAGFRLSGAVMKPVLKGLRLEETASKYEEFILSVADQNIYRIGLLGIGPDGHTAGLLPGSQAIDSPKFVDYYEGPDYQRITLTGRGLSVLDKAVVYAAGAAKQSALTDLPKNIEPVKQPAQLLKRIPDVDVYNDVIGENV
jgi:6-phosphogluconolactonase/glucosamine-6-phosphate isomerase/deaminase